MKSTIQLRQGDMFAQPTDLIIIPCSTVGTITDSVAKQLEEFDIEGPRGHSNLGDVKFELFKGASNIATYVGYATSVRAMQTNVEAIADIAESVARFISDKTEIRDVAIPLLGARAGGLTPEQSLSALMSGFERFSTNGKVLNIFVLQENVFQKLASGSTKTQERPKRKSRAAKAPEREPLRVFISYTKTSREHQEWVRNLATHLRANGIDARLDIWHLRLGMDAAQWMCNELDQADRVLIICNEEYASRAKGRLGGVGWEIRVIQGDLLQSQSSNPKKYIPIIKGRLDEASVPSFLIGAYALTWTDSDANAKRKQLVDEIYEVLDEAPPLGQPPRYVVTRHAI
jgi:TIR domain